jgi:hypothetical protein
MPSNTPIIGSGYGAARFVLTGAFCQIFARPGGIEGIVEESLQAATDTINRLTNFKRTPVREGSQPYYQCLAASKVIQEVEAGAADLQAERTRLEATVREVEDAIGPRPCRGGR